MIENCPMRHENGNCIPAGGFCTANKNICEALLNAYRMGKAQLSQEDTTKDAISRQAALEKVRAMQTYKLFMGDDMILVDKAEVQTELMMLPSVQPETPCYLGSPCEYQNPDVVILQPEPHDGHWILHESPDGGEQYECSECGVLWEFNDGTPEDNEAYYCPKCGAKMKGESNE